MTTTSSTTSEHETLIEIEYPATNEGLIFILNKLHPNAKHGKDFWVAQHVDPATNERTGGAFVAAWNIDTPPPTIAKFKKLKQTHASAWWDEELRQLKKTARAKIQARHAKLLNRITNNASAQERDTWMPKSVAAEAWLADSATSSQRTLLEYEAETLGETVDELVRRILAKSAAYHALVGVTSGVLRKALSALEGCANIIQIEPILAKMDKNLENALAVWRKRKTS